MRTPPNLKKKKKLNFKTPSQVRRFTNDFIRNSPAKFTQFG